MVWILALKSAAGGRRSRRHLLLDALSQFRPFDEMRPIQVHYINGSKRKCTLARCQTTDPGEAPPHGLQMVFVRQAPILHQRARLSATSTPVGDEGILNACVARRCGQTANGSGCLAHAWCYGALNRAFEQRKSAEPIASLRQRSRILFR